MITPRFSLTQDDNTCTIKIRAPYCSLRELDVEVEENVFIFLCKPYYLRLHLPGSLQEIDCKSSFNSDNGEFVFTYGKAIPGEHFKDLEFITKLLVPKFEISEEGKKKIEVLTSDGPSESTEISPDNLNKGFGFAMQGHYNFGIVSSEFSEVFEIDPREVELSDRRKLRLQYEQGKFNAEHYLADLKEDEEIQEWVNFKAPFSGLNGKEIVFTAEELDFLKDLTNVEYKLSDLQKKYCYYGLLDVLYAYLYDRRINAYDECSESGWTVCKLAATFCWLEGYNNAKEALTTVFRRSLIYPLYRNFELSQKVFTDLKEVLKIGEMYIIKCLINLYTIFIDSDYGTYILNNLFLKDYICYIMKWDKQEWSNVVKDVESIEIKKEDLGLNLLEIERGFDLNVQLSNMTLKDSDDSSGTSDSDDSESDSSDNVSDSSSSDSTLE